MARSRETIMTSTVKNRWKHLGVQLRCSSLWGSLEVFCRTLHSTCHFHALPHMTAGTSNQVQYARAPALLTVGAIYTLVVCAVEGIQCSNYCRLLLVGRRL